MITSRANPRVKALAALKKAAVRTETGQTLAEGVHLVQEGLAAGNTVKTLLLSESGNEREDVRGLCGQAEAAGCEVLRLSDACYEKISQLRAPEGIAAVVDASQAPLEPLLTPDARLLVAVQVQDPGNGGALVRVAEAAGASGCVFLDGVDPSHPRLLRAAMGSTFRLPVVSSSTTAFLESVGPTSLALLAAVTPQTTGAVSFREAAYTPPVALCVGGEGGGLPSAFLDGAAVRLAIPMRGAVESLNVAVAAGILLFQARTKWEGEAC